jgi:hypothetical protein
MSSGGGAAGGLAKGRPDYSVRNRNAGGNASVEAWLRVADITAPNNAARTRERPNPNFHRPKNMF